MKYYNPIELRHTVDDMLSGDYKTRFCAEYWQTKIRYEKLKDFCNKIEAYEKYGIGTFLKHDVPLCLLREQQSVMGQYLHILEIRAVMECVELNNPIKSNDKCDCYTQDGKCMGTKETDPVSCEADKSKCIYAHR